MLLGLAASALVPQPVAAAERITTFDTVALVANPQPWTVTGLANTINGTAAGTVFGRIFSGRADAAGVVIDYGFTTPKQAVTALLLDNNGGGDLNDNDGIGTAAVQVFDSNGAVLFSGQLVAGNGGSTFRTSFPDALDDVALRAAFEHHQPGARGRGADIIWRELRAVQLVSTPRIVSTTSTADASADDVVIESTDDLPGTLSWTLYGPVRPGPSGTCTDANWTGAAVYAVRKRGGRHRRHRADGAAHRTDGRRVLLVRPRALGRVVHRTGAQRGRPGQ